MVEDAIVLPHASKSRSINDSVSFIRSLFSDIGGLESEVK
jgi:hypothetical protein